MDVVFGSVDKAGHALMAGVFADGGQALGIGKMHAHIAFGRLLQHIAGAGVVFAFLHIKFEQAFGVLPQAGINGVKAVDQSFVAHGRQPESY